MRFEVFTVVLMKVQVSWDVMPFDWKIVINIGKQDLKT